MSLSVWSRFANFCVEIIRSRSLFEAATLVSILTRLEDSDRERVIIDISQRLVVENAELYRWFFLEVLSFAASEEQRAEIAEQLNINIATVQKLEGH